MFSSRFILKSSLLSLKNRPQILYATFTGPKLLQDDVKTRQEKLEDERIQAEIANMVKKPRQNSLLEPYVKLMRLDKLAPFWLVYWPGAWGILGAASYLNTQPDLYMLALFGMGGLAMRTAGCIVNDIWDKNYDRKVERTKDRPLASSQIGVPAALGLLGLNLSVALSALLQLNLTTQVLGACCLFPVAIYPAAKRFTNWPQAVLGVTFSWGALMGWSAIVCSNLPQSANILSFLPAVFLYFGCVNWTLFYDTIYAFQDINFDKKLGLKSSAIAVQDKPVLWLLGFSGLCVSNLALFGWLTSQEPIYYISLGLATAHFAKQMAFVNFKSPESCAKQFRSNNTIGAIMTFGLMASLFIK
ncbi:4-hydroxybenzoate mitochondrial-like [Brachionus plicatilis]|uniref:4-hydroxybenzoate polyprenyltransferase, mitochondrial n=1 Tax=Brachionus plicatilis TaxID=10195 RepID=A0A3M7SM99_BRAPC|nr:4-hydroxybenzoate mitochondrial-like [Brachionus plicatilis]